MTGRPSFWRTMASRRWVAAMLLALLFSTAALFLGRWQWHRHEAKSERADLISANYAREPSDLGTVFPGGRLDPGQQWTPVRASGRYDLSRQVLIRNRPMDKFYGYEVLVPLVLQDGRAVLVDRGWVPFAEDARAVPRVPGAFTGPVTVVGWARPGEQAVSRASEPMQLTAIDIPQARELTRLDLTEGYLVLREESRPGQPVPERPAPLKPPSTDTGPHFAYSLQWWAATALAPVLVLWGVRRDLDDQRAAGEEGDAQREGAPSPAAPGRGRRTAASDARAPRKRRLWDTDTEEDEEISGGA